MRAAAAEGRIQKPVVQECMTRQHSKNPNVYILKTRPAVSFSAAARKQTLAELHHPMPPKPDPKAKAAPAPRGPRVPLPEAAAPAVDSLVSSVIVDQPRSLMPVRISE
jgi:hypothetical protein